MSRIPTFRERQLASQDVGSPNESMGDAVRYISEGTKSLGKVLAQKEAEVSAANESILLDNKTTKYKQEAADLALNSESTDDFVSKAMELRDAQMDDITSPESKARFSSATTKWIQSQMGAVHKRQVTKRVTASQAKLTESHGIIRTEAIKETEQPDSDMVNTFIGALGAIDQSLSDPTAQKYFKVDEYRKQEARNIAQGMLSTAVSQPQGIERVDAFLKSDEIRELFTPEEISQLRDRAAKAKKHQEYKTNSGQNERINAIHTEAVNLYNEGQLTEAMVYQLQSIPGGGLPAGVANSLLNLLSLPPGERGKIPSPEVYSKAADAIEELDKALSDDKEVPEPEVEGEVETPVDDDPYGFNGEGKDEFSALQGFRSFVTEHLDRLGSDGLAWLQQIQKPEDFKEFKGRWDSAKATVEATFEMPKFNFVDKGEFSKLAALMMTNVLTKEQLLGRELTDEERDEVYRRSTITFGRITHPEWIGKDVGVVFENKNGLSLRVIAVEPDGCPRVEEVK